MEHDDKVFLEKLYTENFRSVKMFIKSLLYSKNEDDIIACVQDVFLVAIEKLDLLKNHDNKRAWLYITAKYIAFNENKKFLKRKMKLMEIDEKMLSTYQDTFADNIIEDIIYNNIDLPSAMQDIFGQLTVDEFKLMKLKFQMNQGNIEIAKNYNISENNVRARISRLKKKIQVFNEININKFK
ncbi:MAG: RNA polymerase sigma factor [Eubacteriales bacterium]